MFKPDQFLARIALAIHEAAKARKPHLIGFMECYIEELESGQFNLFTDCTSTSGRTEART